MKISRRKFITLGAAALVAGVLPKEKEETFPDWRSFEPGLLEETERQIAQAARSCPPIEIIVQRGHCSPTPAERLYAKSLEAMPVEAKEQQLAFIEEVLKTGGDVWPTPPENLGLTFFCGPKFDLEVQRLDPDPIVYAVSGADGLSPDAPITPAEAMEKATQNDTIIVLPMFSEVY